MQYNVNAAGVLIQHPNNKSLYLGIKRDDRKHDDGVDLVCGKVDEGEHPLETAIREAYEEAGVNVSIENPTPFCMFEKDAHGLVSIYHATCADTLVSSDEGEVGWWPISAFKHGNFSAFNAAMFAYYGLE